MEYSPFYSAFVASGAPAAALAVDYADGHVIRPHHHDRAQLLYAIQGVMTIEAQGGRWVVPPTRGVWLEADVAHSVRMSGAVRMRTVFVDSRANKQLPARSCVLDISPLLRELIVAAVEMDVTQPKRSGSRDWHLLHLLLQELRSLPVLPLYLPMPADARLRKFCDALMRQPDAALTLDEWAARLHVSTRTLHRQFLQQTGMRLGQWRRQARLLLALEHLAGGARVVDVALEHGYTSQSAFAAMFKKHFGVSPAAFYRQG
ncbi:AraC family transcriptional regulator [Achromobacter sp. ESBL13]|uniref:AraC family transcriptional regulator n=1 Tax=Achromobacter sp. ESBL13 TaxID=3077328 RepID=UPI002FC62597